MKPYIKNGLITALVIIELFLLVLLFSPRLINRFELAEAIVENIKNPSSKSKAVLEAEYLKTNQIELCTDGLLIVAILVNAYSIVIIKRKKVV